MAVHEEDYSCVGYHGTSADSADIILKTKKFINSVQEDDWLGKGVYFFENDKLQAVNFVSKARGITDYRIISADINTTRLLDLIDTATYINFYTFANRMKDRYKTTKDHKPRKLLNSVVLNAMYKLNPYDAVRAPFIVPSARKAPRTNIEPTHIQICVRQHTCMSNIREVSL